ncbi:MAG: PLP-dependent aminotransferase family protein [Kangiellaceae bacterium]|nr:PLP-dependent aminotransferase family protein [Kangiellaceae bacterium]
METKPDTKLPFTALSFNRNESLSEQIVLKIKELIYSEAIVKGDKLPSSRTLASQLNFARGTVQTAYEILSSQNYIISKKGAGTFVNYSHSTKKEPHSTKVNGKKQYSSKIDLSPLNSITSSFPTRKWKQAMAHAMNNRQSLEFESIKGDKALRKAIADYLRRSNGMIVKVDNIIITNSTVHAMDLIKQIIKKESFQVVMESPAYSLANKVFGSDIFIRYISSSSSEGLAGELNKYKRNNELFYCTSSIQFPTGKAYSLSELKKIVSWAEETESYILEDHYTSGIIDSSHEELLWHLLPSRVIYVGTMSMTMFRGLRIGFAVVPDALIDKISAEQALMTYSPSSQTQHALARFIEQGNLEIHTRRLRKIYKDRIKLLLSIIGKTSLPVKVEGEISGIFAVLKFPKDVDCEQLAEMILDNGVIVHSLTSYFFDKQISNNSLIIGFANIKESELIAAINIIEKTYAGYLSSAY